jgi:hypothetical protein
MTESGPAGIEPLVGDRERRAADEVLQAAVGDGVITLSEYDERAALLWQARTRRQVDAVLADLPDAQAAPVRQAGPADARPRRVVAVMSEDTLHGAVAPGQDVQGWALMGKAVVDLRRTDLPDGTRVQVGALMGEVEVQVPPGTNVHLTGLSVMGDRKVRVAPGNGPHLHVNAQALMGSVNVTVGDGSVVEAGRPAAAAPGRAVTSRRSVPQRQAGSRVHGLVHRIRGAGVAGVLGLAVVASVASGTDARALFSSDVAPGPGDKSVSVLFGSVDVVVPDGAQVDKGGLVVFGSVECGDACSASSDGPVVQVRSIGAFGSVTILTQSEYEQQDRRDRLDDADDD